MLVGVISSQPLVASLTILVPGASVVEVVSLISTLMSSSSKYSNVMLKTWLAVPSPVYKFCVAIYRCVSGLPGLAVHLLHRANFYSFEDHRFDCD